jgi:hypothetical protein
MKKASGSSRFGATSPWNKGPVPKGQQDLGRRLRAPNASHPKPAKPTPELQPGTLFHSPVAIRNILMQINDPRVRSNYDKNQCILSAENGA